MRNNIPRYSPIRVSSLSSHFGFRPLSKFPDTLISVYYLTMKSGEIGTKGSWLRRNKTKEKKFVSVSSHRIGSGTECLFPSCRWSHPSLDTTVGLFSINLDWNPPPVLLSLFLCLCSVFRCAPSF